MPASVYPGIRTACPLILCLALVLSLGAGLPAEETENGADVAALLRKAQAGDPAAQLEVSEHFLINSSADTDDAPARDFKLVEKWLQAAALKGSAPASRMLGELLISDYPGIPVNPARAFAAFQKASSAGDVLAMITLADFHANGTGTPQDFAKAEEWMNKAFAKAAEGSPERDQASMMLVRLAELREVAAEKEALTTKAAAGDLEARFELGDRLLDEAGSDEAKRAVALDHLRAAAEGGHPRAQDALGSVLEQRDPATGFAWRLKAADAGLASAQGYVGLVLLRGTDGIPQDLARGLDYIMRAQAQGDKTASRMLSNDGFFPGLGSKAAGRLAFSQNPADLAVLSAAAERGEVQANYWLGAYYYIHDTERSTTLYEKAASQGHIGAMKSLATAYAYGLGTRKNQEQAFAWVCRAALLDHREVHLELAERYFKGEGTPKNPTLARYWYERVMDPANANSAEKELASKQLVQLKAPAAAGSAIGESTLAAAALARLPSTMPAAPVAVASAPVAKPDPAPSATATRTPDEHRAAAEKGDVESMYQLGLADLERRQIESNQHTGPYYPDPQRNAADFRWIMSAARAGHPGAQFLAATHWLSAETDAAKKAWLEKAAAQNHATAQERLAALTKDAANAAAQAAVAAKQTASDRELAAKGDADAAFRLFRTRMKEIVSTILADFSAGQNGQPTSGKNYQLGYLDADMIKWGDAITNSLHADGLLMLHDYLRDARPDFAYRALLLRERIAKTDLRLQPPDGGIGTNSRAGFEKALAHLRGKLTADQRAQTEKATADQFGGPKVDNVIGANFERGVAGFPQDHGLALVHYRRAAEAGYASGQTNLARCYHYGLGVAKDLDQARTWYSQAAAQGNVTAREQLQLMDTLTGMVRLKTLSAEERAKLTELDWAQAEFQFLNGEQREKLHSPDPTLAVALGINYRDGANGFVQDHSRAYHWFSEAAKKGSGTAEAELGNLLFRGQGRPVDKAAAYAYFLRAAERGDAVGQLNAGFCLLQGEGASRDPLAAHDWLAKAAAQGQANAQSLLKNLRQDPGLQLLLAQRNEQQALRNTQQGVAAALSNPPTSAPAYDPIRDNPILQQAALATKALQGDAKAQAEFDRGQRGEKTQRALINGNAAVPAKPGDLAKRGAEAGDRGDQAEARHLLEQSARAGDTFGMIWLSDLLRDGKGGPTDLKGARTWLEQAGRNHPLYNSHHVTLEMFETNAAAEWQDAVVNADAAKLYTLAQGLESTDREKALELYGHAARFGHQLSIDALEQLKKTPSKVSASLHAQPTGDPWIDAILANTQLPDTGDQEKDAAIRHKASAETLAQMETLRQKAIPAPTKPELAITAKPTKPPAAPAKAPVELDGKVAELNPGTFATLQRIKQRQPGALTEVDAKELKQAMLSGDGTIDEAERDLLAEMTNSQFRSIQVRSAGAKPDSPAVMLYPVSGNTKTVLRELFQGKPDFEVEWNRGAAGYGAICNYYKVSSEAEAAVLRFVAQKFAIEWEKSNQANGYKPLRDLIGRLYGYSNSLGNDMSVGRTLIYRTMNQIDRDSKDQVPDFLYNWVRPGAYAK